LILFTIYDFFLRTPLKENKAFINNIDINTDVVWLRNGGFSHNDMWIREKKIPWPEITQMDLDLTEKELKIYTKNDILDKSTYINTYFTSAMRHIHTIAEMAKLNSWLFSNNTIRVTKNQYQNFELIYENPINMRKIISRTILLLSLLISWSVYVNNSNFNIYLTGLVLFLTCTWLVTWKLEASPFKRICLMYRNPKIIINETGITYQYAQKTVFLAWTDITSINNSVIHLSNGKKHLIPADFKFAYIFHLLLPHNHIDAKFYAKNLSSIY
jgi:hypothetical protein